MQEHKLLVAELINGFLRWLLSLVGIIVEPPKEIVPTHLLMTVIVTLLIIVFFKMMVKNLSLFPNKVQNGLEMFYKFFQGLVDDTIGHEGRKFIPPLATLGIFIAISNLVGLLPEMGSPTANVNIPLGCAVFIFIYYHVQGVRKHGLWGYIKTFMGPVWWLSWLFFPIEIVSHFSRPLSLTLRLFGNIYGEDLVIIVVASLLAVGAPLPIMGLATFTSLLQAFIFVMLSTIYLAGAVAHEH